VQQVQKRGPHARVIFTHPKFIHPTPLKKVVEKYSFFRIYAIHSSIKTFSTEFYLEAVFPLNEE
jgi:hypothetical protein